MHHKHNSPLDNLLYILATRNIDRLDGFLRKHPETLYSKVFDESLLHYSANSGYNKAVEYLIYRGLDVNEKGGRRGADTPLHYAVVKCLGETVTALLDAGAEVNAPNDRRETALHRAVCSNRAENVQILIRYGADVNIQDKDGDTPLHINERSYSRVSPRYRSHELYDRRPITKLLCDNGADIFILNRDGKTAIDITPIC